MNIFNQSFTGISNSPTQDKFNYATFIAMLLTMTIASVLNVFPLDVLLANLRPLFLFIVGLFWVMHSPENFGVVFIFIVGIISDFLLDTRLGQQAFSAVISVLVFQYLTKNQNRVPDLTLWIYATISIIVFSLTLLGLQYLDGQVVIWRNGLPMFTSILIWPVIVFFLKRF